MLHAVIMAGGSGTRFWPASRADCPKQMLNLVGDQTMIQDTVARLEGFVPPIRILIVTNVRLADALARQIPQLPADRILGEPCKRDTAPCIGLAAIQICRRDEQGTMVVMPADHVIRPVARFQAAVQFATRLVEENPNRLVTFGIRPTYPAESFGYIQRGDLISTPSHENSSQGVRSTTSPAFLVQKFREKPTAKVAQGYLESGDYYWNSGIFVWKAARIMEELARHEPDMYGHLERIANATDLAAYPDILRDEFTAIKSKSIDYAVMEQADEVVVVEAPFEWDDVGSWQAIARLRGADGDGNTITGQHLGIDTKGTIVRTSDEHLVVTLGVKDCVIVHTPHATLVANKHDEESVRKVVKLIEEKGWNNYL